MCGSGSPWWRAAALRVVGPERDGAVGGGGQEGQVLRMPSALDHLITVFSDYSQRQLFR